MKTKLIKFMLIASVGLGIGITYFVYDFPKKVEKSNLLFYNIEALANNESGGNIYCCGNYGDCMKVTDVNTGITYTVKGVQFKNPCP